MPTAVLAVLALALAVADDAPYEDAMAAGHKAYDAMALEDALADFQRAAAVDGVTVEDEVSARVWLGVTYAELAQFKEAKAAFVDAIRRDRGAKLPAGLPPKTIGLFEAARLIVDPPPGPPEPAVVDAPPVEHARPVIPDSLLARPATDDAQVDAEHPWETAPSSDGSDDADELVVVPQAARPPWILIASGAVAGGALLLVGTGAVLDIAAGPKPLDGGIASNALYGAGAALVVTAGALAVVGLVAN